MAIFYGYHCLNKTWPVGQLSERLSRWRSRCLAVSALLIFCPGFFHWFPYWTDISGWNQLVSPYGAIISIIKWGFLSCWTIRLYSTRALETDQEGRLPQGAALSGGHHLAMKPFFFCVAIWVPHDSWLYGGFLNGNIIQSLDHDLVFSVGNHGDLGISHFQKPQYSWGVVNYSQGSEQTAKQLPLIFWLLNPHLWDHYLIIKPRVGGWGIGKQLWGHSLT